jgi:hypothetical protein
MSSAGLLIKWIARVVSLIVLYVVFFVVGAMAVGDLMPSEVPAEPGLLPDPYGLLIVAIASVFVIAAVILTSRWSGWRLALGLALAYYGAVTFVMQIETWYFLSSITVSPQLLLRLFVMGIPTALLFIPVAVWILGKGRAVAIPTAYHTLPQSITQWIWKLAAIAVVYLIFYWGAGYFIAWQNPELRAFYGAPGDALPLLLHTANTVRQDPWLFPFQILRALVWTLCALPIIRGSRMNPWWTALLVGLFFSVPQNIGHILANPLIPLASVRLSHMIETASSTFIFGTIVVWLLHREHQSLRDLIPIFNPPVLSLNLSDDTPSRSMGNPANDS